MPAPRPTSQPDPTNTDPTDPAAHPNHFRQTQGVAASGGPAAAGEWGGTPPPPPAEHRPKNSKGGWLAPLAVILVSLAALAAVFFVTQGGDDGQQAAPTSPTGATTPGPSSAKTPDATSSTPEATSSTKSTTSSSTSSSSTSATLPAGVKVCGRGVGAGATTTCGFATNVASAVRSAGKDSGTFSVGAWSPTTKKDYTLRCSAAPVTVCTGGRAAVIYVTD